MADTVAAGKVNYIQLILDESVRRFAFRIDNSLDYADDIYSPSDEDKYYFVEFGDVLDAAIGQQIAEFVRFAKENDKSIRVAAKGPNANWGGNVLVRYIVCDVVE